MRFTLLVVVTALSLLAGPRYNPGVYTVRDIWVDPAFGDDARNGSSRATALRTVRAAWGRVPADTSSANTGFRLLLAPGTYDDENLPRYWELKRGTATYPIIVAAADGPGTARIAQINGANLAYFYLQGIRIEGEYAGGDLVHFENSDHLWLSKLTLTGVGDVRDYGGPQEVLKVNQSTQVYVEDSDLSGGWDQALDFVAVRYGHVSGNRFHRAGDWCVYVKGGSAYLRIEDNEIYDCGNGGFTAGQGTGLEFMQEPWVHYEAYDVQFVNNLVHDTDGAGFGTNGGYNILLAWNTLVRVGRLSHAIEVGFGERSCDGNLVRCQELLNLGAWGTINPDVPELIPSRNVYIYNNLVYNPAPYRSEWQHSAIAGPRERFANIRLAGNWIWNGPADLDLGAEDLDPTLLRSENSINTVEPALDPDFHLRSLPPAVLTVPIPPFPGGDRPSFPPTPEGELSPPTGHQTGDPPGQFHGFVTFVKETASPLATCHDNCSFSR